MIKISRFGYPGKILKGLYYFWTLDHVNIIFVPNIASSYFIFMFKNSTSIQNKHILPIKFSYNSLLYDIIYCWISVMIKDFCLKE